MPKLVIKCFICGREVATPVRRVSSELIELEVRPCRNCLRNAGAGALFNIAECLRRSNGHSDCSCDDCVAKRIMMRPADFMARPDRKKGPTGTPPPMYCAACGEPALLQCVVCGVPVCGHHGYGGSANAHQMWKCRGVSCVGNVNQCAT